MAYHFKYTSNFITDFDNCLEYLLYNVGGTGNSQAARNFLADFNNIESLLKDYPFGFPICEDCVYNDERKIHFRHMSYKIFYHVDGNLIILDALCHDLQDYNNHLKNLEP